VNKTTLIKNIAWAILWDDDSDQHVYARNIDIAIRGDLIIFLGSKYTGEVDETIDGSELLVIPGLINIHSHGAHEPAEKGVREEHYSPKFHSGL
jgi:cytosine/adenosine deaminase-related metal-dependent hydrolase